MRNLSIIFALSLIFSSCGMFSFKTPEMRGEEKIKLSEILSNPDSSNDDLMNGGKRLSIVMDELESKSDRWLELSEFA